MRKGWRRREGSERETVNVGGRLGGREGERGGGKERE